MVSEVPSKIDISRTSVILMASYINVSLEIENKKITPLIPNFHPVDRIKITLPKLNTV